MDSLWRHKEALPLSEPYASLGEGRTSLVRLTGNVSAQLDYLMPTLSFEDRGAFDRAGPAARPRAGRAGRRGQQRQRGHGGRRVGARAGLDCAVYVPEATSPKKLEQIRAHGARLEVVPGDREAAARAARAAADEPDVFYASHVYNPYFPHGTKTYVYELWQDLGGRSWWRCRPGRWPRRRGRLRRARRTRSPYQPRRPWRRASRSPARRARRILRAVRESGGTLRTVSDEQIRDAQRDLARRGLFVEPTGVACWAAVTADPPRGERRRTAVRRGREDGTGGTGVAPAIPPPGRNPDAAGRRSGRTADERSRDLAVAEGCGAPLGPHSALEPRCHPWELRMRKSTLRSAAAAAALATGLAAASVTTASAAPRTSDRPAAARIATPEQLADSVRQAVERELSEGGAVAEGNVVGFVAPQSDTGVRPC